MCLSLYFHKNYYELSPQNIKSDGTSRRKNEEKGNFWMGQAIISAVGICLLFSYRI